MAGSLVQTFEADDAKGYARVRAVMTADASGDATATALPEAIGRLVGVKILMGTFDLGNAIITVTDEKGATLIAVDTDAFKFGSTTTGDTTGGTAENLFTTGANHGLVVGDVIRFITRTGGTLPALSTNYAVKTVPSATTFTLSSTALAAGAELEIGATDVTASEWVLNNVGRRFRPAVAVNGSDGVAIAAATSAPTIKRDIVLTGPMSIGMSQGGNLGVCTVDLIVAP